MPLTTYAELWEAKLSRRSERGGEAMALFPKKNDQQPQPGAGQQPAPPPPPPPPQGAQPPRRVLPPAGRPMAPPAAPPLGSLPQRQPQAPAAQEYPAQQRAPIAPRPAAPTKLHARNELEAMLAEAVRRAASDLHLTRNLPPMVRVDGRLIPLEGWEVLTREACDNIVKNMLTPEQRERFDRDWELDLSIEYPEVGRFRTNVHRQRGTLEAAFRVVNDTIKPIRQLGLPPICEELARRRSGLMIVTGPTGSGKTTTLAAMVDQINHERDCMIITVEDPIEYVHRNRRSIIKQREVTSDTHGFAQALRHVLRQDPDVIVVGEMRDLETIQTALIAAETGHMVFSTLHTPDAVQTVDRIIDVFPPHHQEQTRIQLANTLVAVLAQQLIGMPGSQGRVVGVEILIANSAVRKTVRAGKTEQLMTIIQTSYEQGMISMDKSLKNLYLQGLITFDDAISRCKFPESFEQI
jgi:twitching motility protein PilT